MNCAIRESTGRWRGKAVPGRRPGLSPATTGPIPTWSRWTVTESSYGGGGEGFVRITPREGGGSSVHAEWSAVNARRRKPLLFVIHHGPMRMVISRMWVSALNRYGSEEKD